MPRGTAREWEPRVLAKILALSIAAAAVLIPAYSPAYSDESVTGMVVYGDDSRRDIHEVKRADWAALADSTVALFRSKNIHRGQLLGASLRDGFPELCSTERFLDQPSMASCSGVLVAPNLVLTAAHCVRGMVDCFFTKVVFGYRYESASSDPTHRPHEDIYSCRTIVERQFSESGPDFTLFKLDRPVHHHAPVKLNLGAHVRKGDELFVIGHPLGLPAKLADGAKVRRVVEQAGFFVANLDTFGGNSGSPVFNARTNELEGIIVRGEDDFDRHGRCLTARFCKERSCRGEDVVFSSVIAPYIGKASASRYR